MSHQSVLLIKIDFEKAYNRIKWQFILAMLKALGFVPIFINFISMLFKHTLEVLNLNNSHLDSIGLFWSILQDFPISPLSTSWLLKLLDIFLLLKWPRNVFMESIYLITKGKWSMNTLWMTLSSPLGRVSNLSQLLSIAWIFFTKPLVQVSNGKRPLVTDNWCMTLLLGYRAISGSGSTLEKSSNFFASPLLFMTIWISFGAVFQKVEVKLNY